MQAKWYKAFPVTDVSVVVIIALSSKKLSQFFKILIFSPDIWGKVHYVCEIDLIS